MADSGCRHGGFDAERFESFGLLPGLCLLAGYCWVTATGRLEGKFLESLFQKWKSETLAFEISSDPHFRDSRELSFGSNRTQHYGCFARIGATVPPKIGPCRRAF